MKKHFLSLICGSVILLSTDSHAQLRYRSSTDILQKDSQAVELQGQFFNTTSSYDQDGVELIQSEGSSYSTNDWKILYSKGFFNKFEGSIFTKYRSIKSESSGTSTTKSGVESVGAEGKYLFFDRSKFSHALGIHLKKSLYTNKYYESPALPPTDQLALGDDGQEIGADYLVTYYDEYLNYDLKFGYNKPSKTLSSEFNFKLEGVYKLTDVFLVAGFGGILSRKNDSYTENPIAKPAISSGDSRLFNSINREKKYLYAGIHYSFSDFIVGLNVESVLSGSSTDKGNTISFNLRWEKPEKLSIFQKPVREDFQPAPNYFADGKIIKISKSGKMVKINIGADKDILIGTSFHIFSPVSSELVSSGVAIDVGPEWTIIKLNAQPIRSTLQAGYITKAF